MLAADANVVTKLTELAATQPLTLKDQFGVETQYTTKPVHEVKAAAKALPVQVSVYTLAGFADLVRMALDKVLLSDYLIHVENYSRVTLKAKNTDAHGRRITLLQAEPVKFEQFQFKEWIEQEDFIIGVNSLFAPTPDKEYVLRIASCLTGEGVSISEDNGFTQKVTVKQGLAIQEAEVIKPQVLLAPFRTFPEVGQPISAFVFRASIEDGDKQLMLTEADGGKWKLDAINEVRRALAVFALKDENGDDITIIA